MKTSRVLLTIGLFAVATSFSFAGPGAEYWTQRRAERTVATNPAPASSSKVDAVCCRVETVRRPIASGKVTLPVQKVTCDGCAAMAAGEKCPTS